MSSEVDLSKKVPTHQLRLAELINELDSLIHSEPAQSYPHIVEALERAEQEARNELGSLLTESLLNQAGKATS